VKFNPDRMAFSHAFVPDPQRHFMRCKKCGLKRSLCEKSQDLPVRERGVDEQNIDERAMFLAHEIFHDRLAPEEEIKEAIAIEIRRFLK